MFPFNTVRYLDLKIVNAGTGVTGLTLSSLVIYFTRNGITCTDVFTLTEKGSGRYQLIYTPSTKGHDYIEVSYAAASYTVSFAEDIIDAASLFGSSNAVTVNQDYSATGFLVPIIASPETYTLYIYNSSDWVSGNTGTEQSLGSTSLTTNGSWVVPSFLLLHGTYHFILRNSTGLVVVFRAFLGI